MTQGLDLISGQPFAGNTWTEVKMGEVRIRLVFGGWLTPRRITELEVGIVISECTVF
jgi:hypothetical protein